MQFLRNETVRKHGIAVVAVMCLIFWTLLTVVITRTIVRNNTKLELDDKYRKQYEDDLEAYKKEQVEEKQKEYWLSGEASLESQIEREAELMCKGNGIWKTDEARYTYWCNVWVRVKRPDYPNSVEEVLKQEKQYDFWNEDAIVDKGEKAKCMELLRMLHSGIFPAHLTLEHQYLEMKDNGAVCVLHTTYDHRGNDDPWKWKD